MNLDQNLFTLNISARESDPSITDLVAPNGEVYYSRRRLPGDNYGIEVFDPLSQSTLASAAAPSPVSKRKTLLLHNPESIVEFRSTGTITFRWAFKWEEHEFEWKREECYLIRKPDPAVLVAITKEPPGRLKTTCIQLLYYNLNRFDINDRKGLEVVILTALLTLQDLNDAYHAPAGSVPAPAPKTPSPPPGLLVRLGLSRQGSASLLPPPPPPPEVSVRPPQRVGIERIAEMQALRTAQGIGEANEVEVTGEGDIDDYARFAESMLKEDAMLFITVRSASAAEVPKVLRVVEETKRLRHKSGLDEAQELHQYVLYDVQDGVRKGPKRINLNDPQPTSSGYTPPSSLVVHLSKIDMPEFRPKVARTPSPPRPPTPPRVDQNGKGKGKEKPVSDKERRKAEKERAKAEKEKAKAEKKAKKSSAPQPAAPPPTPPKAKLAKPSPGASALGAHGRASSAHVPSHHLHPHQPSPSPSQLNNPAIYAAPPPALPRARSTRARPVSYYGGGGQYGSTPPLPARPLSMFGLAAANPPDGPPTGPVTALLNRWSKH